MTISLKQYILAKSEQNKVMDLISRILDFQSTVYMCIGLFAMVLMETTTRRYLDVVVFFFIIIIIYLFQYFALHNSLL